MKVRTRFAVAALIMAALLAISSTGVLAATKSVVVDVKCTTGKPVPVSLTMDEVREGKSESISPPTKLGFPP